MNCLSLIFAIWLSVFCWCCKAEGAADASEIIPPSPEVDSQFPPESHHPKAEEAAEEEDSPVTTQQQPPVDEDLSQLVSARISFPNGEKLLDRKPTTMEVHVTNAASKPIYVLTLIPSYPKLKGTILQPIRLVAEVSAKEPETGTPAEWSQKFTFTCELDQSGSIDFSLDLSVYNFKDEKKPIIIPAYFGSLPISKQTNEYLDAKALGIYAMFACIAFVIFRFVHDGGETKQRIQRKKASPASESDSLVDSDWIPQHHLKKQSSSSNLKKRSVPASESEEAGSASE